MRHHFNGRLSKTIQNSSLSFTQVHAVLTCVTAYWARACWAGLGMLGQACKTSIDSKQCHELKDFDRYRILPNCSGSYGQIGFCGYSYGYDYDCYLKGFLHFNTWRHGTLAVAIRVVTTLGSTTRQQPAVIRNNQHSW